MNILLVTLRASLKPARRKLERNEFVSRNRAGIHNLPLDPYAVTVSDDKKHRRRGAGITCLAGTARKGKDCGSPRCNNNSEDGLPSSGHVVLAVCLMRSASSMKLLRASVKSGSDNAPTRTKRVSRSPSIAFTHRFRCW